MAAPLIHDVFLSFSGIDTRYAFTAHLRDALKRHGLKTFRDDTELERGEKIGPGLLEAIEQSRVSIIVFSTNYTSSDWCLDELVKIMNCHSYDRDPENDVVFKRSAIHIFYDGEPEDVQNQKGCYAIGQAYPSHRMLFDLKSVKNWSLALTEAGRLSGFVRKNVANGCESALIEHVVGEVSKILNIKCLNVADYPVGIQHRVQPLREFLKLGEAENDVRIVVIWGISGIGKTTMAKEMYNCMYGEFKKSSSFVADIGQTSKQPNGLLKLQKRLLCDLVGENQKITSMDNGIEVLKRLAWGRKVLLVLDDVNNISQLRALSIDRDLFLPGSRIIVTTTDLSSVSSLRAGKVYKPNELYEQESLRLFSWHAFMRDRPEEGYEILSKDVVSYAKGLPLVLKILGSYLLYRTKPEWTSELNKLKNIPHPDVQAILRLSFDSLDGGQKDGEQKGLFQHIACFFVGMDQDFSIKILEGCGFFPEAGIGILSRRGLVSIDRNNRLRMHDLIQIMAREIVRQESIEEPGKRSRLWYHKDVLNVLKNKRGTDSVQGLVLNLPESKELQLDAKETKEIQGVAPNSPESKELVLNATTFIKMKTLKLLHLNYVQLSGSYKHISKGLVWLSWRGFSSNYIQSSLFMENLVALDLSYSKLKQVWGKTKSSKGPVLFNLKYLNLGHSYFLIKTPDFTGFTSLEKLLLNDCTKLVEVHQSIASLENLLVLDLENCLNLEKIPWSIFMLKSLDDINLFGCSKLQWPAGPAPESSLQLSSSIRRLNLEDCNMTCVPSQIGSFMSLEFLNLSRNNFSNLPATITSLTQLQTLYVNHCTRLESVPALPENLLGLSANYCTSLESVSMESKVTKAPVMTFYGCSKLVNNNFAHNFRTNLLHCYQKVAEQGKLDIILPGSEIPRWFNYQTEGYMLHFQLPRLESPRTIQGFIFCIVYTTVGLNQPDSYLPEISYVFSNLTKSLRLTFREPTFDFHLRTSEDDHMWLSYLPNYRCLSEGGDEVKLRALNDRLWFPIKCGICLVYEGDDIF